MFTKAEKGLERLLDAYNALGKIQPEANGSVTMAFVEELHDKCYEAMNDDFSTPIVISALFEASKTINSILDKKETISEDVLKALTAVFETFAFEILGLRKSASSSDGNNAAREEAFGKVVDMLLEQRMKAKANKDWATSDLIRDRLAALGFEVKDTKDGFSWKLNV